MNRWRWILILAITIFAVRAYFNPTERWWAIWAVLLVAGGIWLQRNELAQEKRAEEAMEENQDCKAFYSVMIGAFLAGIGWALYNHLQWWSLLFGAGSFLLVFCAFICEMMGQEKQKQPT